MYSPAAMLKTPASMAAKPAISTANGWPVAPPTVLTTARTEVSPSWAPKIASRISLRTFASRRSRARWSAIHELLKAEAGALSGGVDTLIWGQSSAKDDRVDNTYVVTLFQDGSGAQRAG